jgi:nicotinate-nucleotide pyrophosphorylase (carboxylating)
MLSKFYIDEIIKTALKEDITYIDSTTDLLIPPDSLSRAYFMAKENGVIAGLQIATRVFTLLDPTIQVVTLKQDGDQVNVGETIAKFKGNTAALLKGERTALNILSHMSGIATYTAKCVELCEGTNTTITDTRKTLPGLRALQKYAVLAGGGKNHRFNLSDAAMLKDNHIDAFGSITAAVTALRKRAGHMLKIEVEARTMEDVKEALNCGVDVIMLDNMDINQMKDCVAYVKGRAVLEASGNITLENLRDVASTGVDIISLGALTHSVKAFDISMKWK